jgi:AraC-like DNA-binding protein
MGSSSSGPDVNERISGREIDLSLVCALGSIRAHSATRLAWHSHENVELIFLLGGASSYEFSGTGQIELSGGQFLLVPPKTLHRGGQDMRMPSVLCGIVLEPFSKKALRNSTFTNTDIPRFERTFAGELPRVQTMNSALLMLAKGLAEEVRTFKNNPSDALVPARIRSLVCLALIEVVSIVDAAHPRAAMGMVAAAKSFLREHHAEPVKMDELAAYLGFSRARMFAMFKKATGLSPNDYLQRHRIECAREQLRRDEVSITDVALSTGFESSQYFSRVFRKYCGITPTEFREQGCAS